MGKTKLKPCPFCGGTVTIKEFGDYTEHWFCVTRNIGKGVCTCRIFMESEKFYTDANTRAKNEIKRKLIEKWNKRVDGNGH